MFQHKKYCSMRLCLFFVLIDINCLRNTVQIFKKYVYVHITDMLIGQNQLRLTNWQICKKIQLSPLLFNDICSLYKVT